MKYSVKMRNTILPVTRKLRKQNYSVNEKGFLKSVYSNLSILSHLEGLKHRKMFFRRLSPATFTINFKEHKFCCISLHPKIERAKKF